MAKSQLTVDTYTGKLSRLKEDALKLLGVSGLDTLDKLEPFGDSTNDFIEYYIYDLDDNYLGSGKIISIPTNSKLDIGAHLRGLGYERGDYKIVYNFLRRVGGSWKSVLVKKSDKSIYASNEPRWIDTNGKIYAGVTGDTEEELLIKDYKYFLQEISPSRTEVRLAVNPGINDSDYLEEFRLMGYTCLSFTDRVGTAKIDGTGKKVEILNSSKNLIPRMVGGKLVIRDALVIGHDTTPQEITNYKPFKEILPCVDDTQSQISGLIEFANTETLVATLNDDDSGFIPRMKGGTITIKNAIRLVDTPVANFTYTGAGGGTGDGDGDGDETVDEEQFTLTLNRDPTSGGTVSGGGTYNGGTSVDISAVAKPTGWKFIRWHGDIPGSGKFDPTTTIIMHENKTITAEFEYPDYGEEYNLYGGS